MCDYFGSGWQEWKGSSDYKQKAGSCTETTPGGKGVWGIWGVRKAVKPRWTRDKFCFCFVVRQELKTRLVLNSLHSPRWPWTSDHSPIHVEWDYRHAPLCPVLCCPGDITQGFVCERHTLPIELHPQPWGLVIVSNQCSILLNFIIVLWLCAA